MSIDDSRYAWEGALLTLRRAVSPPVASLLARGYRGLPESNLRRAGMRTRKESFQPIARNDPVAILVRDQMHACETNQMLGDSRPRCADQFRQILVPRDYREPGPFAAGHAEILAQLEQNQRQPIELLRREPPRAHQLLNEPSLRAPTFQCPRRLGIEEPQPENSTLAADDAT